METRRGGTVVCPLPNSPVARSWVRPWGCLERRSKSQECPGYRCSQPYPFPSEPSPTLPSERGSLEGIFAHSCLGGKSPPPPQLLYSHFGASLQDEMPLPLPLNCPLQPCTISGRLSGDQGMQKHAALWQISGWPGTSGDGLAPSLASQPCGLTHASEQAAAGS